MTKKDLLKHFWIALAIGCLFRFFSAYFVFGPQALDDYLNQLIPAYKFSEMGAHFLAAWRSPLVVWILAGVIDAAKFLGIESPVGQVQAIYTFIGLFSLTAFVGCYYFFKAIEEYEIGIVALYFTAIHGLMPFVSTRAFLESLSMGPLTLGVGLLIWAVFNERRWVIVAALGSIGFATLIRFQIGAIYVAASLWILIFHRKWWKEVLYASLIVACINADIDLLDNRAPFSTLFAYFKFNQDVSRYGVQPWYSTWAAWLVIGFLPFSFPLLTKVRGLNKKGFREVLVFILLFVLVHSLVPHKEERFMYPIFAISLWLWAALWVWSRDSKAFKRFVRPVVTVVNFIVLLIGCFMNTQVGEVGVPALLSSQSSRVLYIDRASLVGKGWMWEYFVRNESAIRLKQPTTSMAQIVDKLDSKRFDAVTVMTSQEEILPELNSLSSNDQKNYRCSKTYEQSSTIDALIYRMNPGHNQRRRPTWFVVCSDLNWLKAHDYELKESRISYGAN